MDNIIDEASSIYARYGCHDIDHVARSLGVPVYDLLDSDNLRESYFPGLRAIAVSPDLLTYERRHLVAHALGHHLLHRKGPHADYLKLHLNHPEGPATTPDEPRAARTEAEAELFAAYLLIPDGKLRPLLDRGRVRNAADSPLRLALEFQVPLDLMRLRLLYDRRRHSHPQ